MKIAISCLENDMNTSVSGNFGRAPFFLIYNTDEDKTEFLDNSKSNSLASGAGPHTVKSLADYGVKAVFTGRVGPKAQSSLEVSGIKYFVNIDGAVENIISNIKSGTYKLD